MFEKILVPVDGSPISETALPFGKEIAKAFKSELDLLFVCDEHACEHLVEHQNYLKKLASSLKDGSTSVNVSPVVVQGQPGVEILWFAEQKNIGLIVMATHGRTGIREWAFGSVAHKVIQTTKKPLLVIRGTEAEAKADSKNCLSRIMVPLDGSPRGEAALPFVREMLGHLYSEAILLQVVPEGEHVHTVGGINYVRFKEQQIEPMKTSAQKYLAGVAKSLENTKAKARIEVRVGDPAMEIIRLSSELGACLTAMSSHGHTGLERFVYGSITQRVLHGGKTPLLLVRAPSMD